MAQVIATLCDECLAAGDETPGETFGVTVEVPGARSAPYLIDVCERHGKPYRDMLAVLAEHGRRADRKAPLPARVAAPPSKAPTSAGESSGAGFACPVCGHTTAAEGGLRSHVQNEHGITLSEARGEAGIPCPHKGCNRSLGAIQGVMAHLRAAHGLNRDDARALVDSARE